MIEFAKSCVVIIPRCGQTGGRLLTRPFDYPHVFAPSNSLQVPVVGRGRHSQLERCQHSEIACLAIEVDLTEMCPFKHFNFPGKMSQFLSYMYVIGRLVDY